MRNKREREHSHSEIEKANSAEQTSPGAIAFEEQPEQTVDIGSGF